MENRHTDLAYLRELANGNNDFIVQMIDVFMEQTPEALADLEKHLASGDYKSLAGTAHKIKPSFGFMGIKELQPTIAELELKSRNQEEPGSYAGMIAHIREICVKAMDELREERTALAT